MLLNFDTMRMPLFPRRTLHTSIDIQVFFGREKNHHFKKRIYSMSTYKSSFPAIECLCVCMSLTRRELISVAPLLVVTVDHITSVEVRETLLKMNPVYSIKLRDRDECVEFSSDKVTEKMEKIWE